MTHPQTIAERLLTDPNTALTTLEIYPTLRCNLDCAFCDTTDRHQPPMNERSVEEWVRIVHDFADMGGQQLFVLGGGEPFVYPALMSILAAAKDRGLWGMLTTNGTLIRPEQRKHLCDIGWDEIHFSLDGATPETHDKLRGRVGTYRKLIQTICAFRVLRESYSATTPRLVFHWVITNQNLEEITQVFEVARSMGVHRIDFDGLIAYRPEQQALELNATERNRLQDIARQYSELPHEKLGVTHNLSQFCHDTTPRGTKAPEAGKHAGLKGSPCYKPWHHLTVQANGRTSPCCVLAGTGNPITQPLQAFWQNDTYFQNMRQQMLTHQPPKRCAECSPNILQQEQLIQQALIQLSDTP